MNAKGYFRVFAAGVIWLVMSVSLVACAREMEAETHPTTPVTEITVTIVQATATSKTVTSAAPQITETAPAPVETVEGDPFVLGQPGPYFPGKRQYELEGFKRAGVPLSFTVWYPAVKPEGYTGTIVKDGQPDVSGGPYPLVIMSEMVGNELAPHLVTYGFIVGGVAYQGPSDRWGPWLVDFPREILAMLDQIAASPPEGLEGMVDAEHTGVMGYSFDGYNTLAMSGARVDPEFYLQKCAQEPEEGSSVSESSRMEQTYQYFCEMAAEWEEFAENAGESITASDDGLWQPMTDARIRAVMPMAPEGVWLFGERGLAAVDRPSLMICGTQDENETDYLKECAYIFEHMGTPEKGLISFVDQGHMMVFDEEPRRRMNHFITAFFGYHLQGKEEYKDYYSEDFVRQVDDLAWGVVTQP